MQAAVLRESAVSDKKRIAAQSMKKGEGRGGGVESRDVVVLRAPRSGDSELHVYSGARGGDHFFLLALLGLQLLLVVDFSLETFTSASFLDGRHWICEETKCHVAVCRSCHCTPNRVGRQPWLVFPER